MHIENNKRQGFALVVVLSTLSIIALLFAIASSRSISKLAETRTDMMVSERAFEASAILALAAATFGQGQGKVPVDQVYSIIWAGKSAELSLQDVGGLIDLNTAHPEILEKLSQEIGLTSDQLQSYRQWRRAPHRLLRVSDFVRVSGADPQNIIPLTSFTTVHSGRAGVALEFAPSEVFEILGLRSGNSTNALFTRQIPVNWSTAPSLTNYQVRVLVDEEAPLTIGVINLAPTGNGLILHSF